MTRRLRAYDSLRSAAVLAVFAVAAVSCGANTAQVTTERAISPPSSSAVENPPEYGASLEEWGHALADPEPQQGLSPSEVDDPPEQAVSDVPTIEWADLIPPGSSGQEIVDRYEERLDAVEPGSTEATALYDEMRAEFDPEVVNPQLDGQRIRLAGFVAPLTYDDEMVIEFLLVPTYGACVHVPPPPPNQTVMVTVDGSNGLTTDEAWGAVWVEGTITVAPATTELASASYTITNATSGVYNDF